MLYVYKILGFLLKEIGLFLVGKFFIYCRALGLGLEPAPHSIMLIARFKGE